MLPRQGVWGAEPPSGITEALPPRGITGAQPLYNLPLDFVVISWYNIIRKSRALIWR